MELAPVYILLGEEDLLKESAILKIKQKALPAENQATMSFNYVSIDGGSVTSTKIIEECQQLPLMNNTRLVLVKDAERVIDDNLIEYIKNPVETTCLALLIRKIDKRLIIYKTLKEHAEIQEFDHPDGKESIEWIQHFIEAKKKRISTRDASYIADILENNLTGILQELEKLVTYVGESPNITKNDIETIISENKLRDSFSLTEAIQNKDTSSAIKLVNELLNQGNSIPKIMGTIRWMLIRLWQAKELLKNGNRHTLSKEIHIPPYFLNKFIDQAEKFDITELKEGLIKLLAIEKLMRTYTLPQRLILELLVIQLTEKTAASLVNA